MSEIIMNSLIIPVIHWNSDGIKNREKSLKNEKKMSWKYIRAGIICIALFNSFEISRIFMSPKKNGIYNLVDLN